MTENEKIEIKRKAVKIKFEIDGDLDCYQVFFLPEEIVPEFIGTTICNNRTTMEEKRNAFLERKNIFQEK